MAGVFPRMTRHEPRRQASTWTPGLGVLLGALAILAAGVAAVTFWTVAADPLAVANAVDRGGMRDLATLLAERLGTAVAELLRLIL
jgi:hypothetical protein